LERVEAERRLADDREAEAPTEGLLAAAEAPVEAERSGTTGGRATSLLPGLERRKRGADLALLDELDLLEQRRRLDTPTWGTALSEGAEADPPD